MRLIDADALIKSIQDWYCKDCDHYNYVRCRACGTDDAISAIDEAPTIGGWISVKDRMPEDTRFVLVCNDDKKIMVAQYIDETAQWQYPYIAYDVDVWDDDEQGPIMWWMPLPKPPKEVAGDA